MSVCFRFVVIKLIMPKITIYRFGNYVSLCFVAYVLYKKV